VNSGEDGRSLDMTSRLSRQRAVLRLPARGSHRWPLIKSFVSGTLKDGVKLETRYHVADFHSMDRVEA
jgi:hypothetical protein